VGSIKNFVTTGDRRLRIAQALTDKPGAHRQASWRPAVPKASGHLLVVLLTVRKMTATCPVDMWITTRLVTHCIVSAVTPIEEI